VANSRKGFGKGGSSKIWRYLTVEESYLGVEMSGETCAVWSAMPEKRQVASQLGEDYGLSDSDIHRWLGFHCFARSSASAIWGAVMRVATA
jgi:hypothetical protein